MLLLLSVVRSSEAVQVNDNSDRLSISRATVDRGDSGCPSGHFTNGDYASSARSLGGRIPDRNPIWAQEIAAKTDWLWGHAAGARGPHQNRNILRLRSETSPGPITRGVCRITRPKHVRNSSLLAC